MRAVVNFTLLEDAYTVSQALHSGPAGLYYTHGHSLGIECPCVFAHYCVRECG